jgi:hypothetical protein
MKPPGPQNLRDHLPIKLNGEGRHSIATYGDRFLRYLIFAALYLTLLFYIVGCSGMSDFLGSQYPESRRSGLCRQVPTVKK